MSGPAHWVAVALLAGAAAVALISAVGALAMRDAFQRLHFIAPPATLSSFSVAVAALLDEPQKQAGAKALVVALLLVVMNAVVSHATARAAFVRRHGRWPPAADWPSSAGGAEGPPGG